MFDVGGFRSAVVKERWEVIITNFILDAPTSAHTIYSTI